VEAHRANLKHKLGLRSHAGLLRFALERQLGR
jgi:DNA-binding CsgD family transcriptional regulator